MTPDNGGNNAEVNLREVVSLSLAFIFFIISLVIIISQSIRIYWLKK
jgi:hypothetical protein